MTTVHNTNEACCTIPPVQINYAEKGTYKAHGAFDRVYVTGDNSETALIIVYDIFGYFPQTLQGADILAKTIDAKVFMPDFFGKNAFSIDKYPPKDDQTKQEIQEFFGGIAKPPSNATKLVEFARVLKDQGFRKIGAVGYCWGGKVVTLGAVNEGCPLDAISIVHPAMIAAKDIEELSIPLGLYFSNGESKDEFDKIVGVLSEKPFAAKVDSKYYADMIHGWAAARGDLSDTKTMSDYEDVYSRVSTFFKNAFV